MNGMKRFVKEFGNYACVKMHERPYDIIEVEKKRDEILHVVWQCEHERLSPADACWKIAELAN